MVMHRTQQLIQKSIYLIRDQKVLLDEDLARLYQVRTKVLVQAVKRNIVRFPEDFMFQLSDPEVDSLRRQIGLSKKGRGGRRYYLSAFTKQELASLSGVRHSPRAAAVNVKIAMAAF